MEEYAYDAWENRIFEKDRMGNITNRTFDAWGHLLEEKKPNGLDDAGRCVTVENADGISNYAYNNFAIVCMETNPAGETKKYLYDCVLDLTAVVNPNHYDKDAEKEIRTDYVYDAFHRQIKRVDETGAEFVTYRDGEGNIIKEMEPLRRAMCMICTEM